MRRLLVAVAALSLAATACTTGDEAPVDDLAARADRVAELLDAGEECRALEAARVLQDGADDATLDEEVRTAAARWADQARQHLSCEDPTEGPTDEEPAPQEGDDDSPEGDDDPPADDDSPPGEGNGPPDDPGDGNGPPDDRGQGEGRGGGPGRGQGGG